MSLREACDIMAVKSNGAAFGAVHRENTSYRSISKMKSWLKNTIHVWALLFSDLLLWFCYLEEPALEECNISPTTGRR
jgi:hypothetical protein